MPTLILIVLLALPGGGAAVQTLRDAEAAYEDGHYQACVNYLDRIERTDGRSPRVESLRALALAELGRTTEAYRSVRIYFELTAGQDLSRSSAHADLVRLGERLRGQLEAKRRQVAEEREKLKNAEGTKVEAAEAAVRRDTESRIRERERQFKTFERGAWQRRLHLNAAAARREHEAQRAAAGPGSGTAATATAAGP